MGDGPAGPMDQCSPTFLVLMSEDCQMNFPVSLTISGWHWSYSTSVLRRGSSKTLVGYDQWHPELGLLSKSGGYFRPVPK
jgi:hypothetical protein